MLDIVVVLVDFVTDMLINEKCVNAVTCVSE